MAEIGSHAVEASCLDDHALLERIAADEAAIARLQARQLADLAEFARRPARIQRAGDDPAAASAGRAEPGAYARDTADDEVAMRLRVSRRTAEQRLRLACALVRLPRTRAALTDGLIDVARARVIADEVAAIHPATAREVEARVIHVAPGLTAPRLRERVRRAVLAADPLAAQTRHERERRDRRVVVDPAPDGMAWLSAYLTAPEARTVHAALSSAARAAKRTSGERGTADTMDALRADALVAVFADAVDAGRLRGFGPLARHLGELCTVQVTVAASTLLGFDDSPAQLDGYGPITAAEARTLAPDARWRRVLTDPASGTVLDVGTTVYRPPVALARHVEARDRRCVAPGCGVQASRCELDHVVPFPEGSTSAANLRAECTHHHRWVKHTPAFGLEATARDGTRWTTPTGHTYETRPPPVATVVDCTPGADHAPAEPWWADWLDDAA